LARAGLGGGGGIALLFLKEKKQKNFLLFPLQQEAKNSFYTFGILRISSVWSLLQFLLS
jgi:hypothetical protein